MALDLPLLVVLVVPEASSLKHLERGVLGLLQAAGLWHDQQQ